MRCHHATIVVAVNLIQHHQHKHRHHRQPIHEIPAPATGKGLHKRVMHSMRIKYGLQHRHQGEWRIRLSSEAMSRRKAWAQEESDYWNQWLFIVHANQSFWIHGIRSGRIIFQKKSCKKSSDTKHGLLSLGTSSSRNLQRKKIAWLSWKEMELHCARCRQLDHHVWHCPCWVWKTVMPTTMRAIVDDDT